MFALTHTADLVRESDAEFLGMILFVGLLIIIAFAAVLAVKAMHK